MHVDAISKLQWSPNNAAHTNGLHPNYLHGLWQAQRPVAKCFFPIKGTTLGEVDPPSFWKVPSFNQTQPSNRFGEEKAHGITGSKKRGSSLVGTPHLESPGRGSRPGDPFGGPGDPYDFKGHAVPVPPCFERPASGAAIESRCAPQDGHPGRFSDCCSGMFLGLNDDHGRHDHKWPACHLVLKITNIPQLQGASTSSSAPGVAGPRCKGRVGAAPRVQRQWAMDAWVERSLEGSSG